MVRWEELPYIISKLDNFRRSDKDPTKLSYQEGCNYLK